MKKFLILAVVVCVVLCDERNFKRRIHSSRVDEIHFQEFDSNRKFLQICATQAGLANKDVKTLKEKPMYTLLTPEEQKFICCLTDPLIHEGKLSMDRLKKIVSKKVKSVKVDLDSVKTECEKTGARADELTSCPKIATFAQCAFVKIRNIVKHSHATNIHHTKPSAGAAEIENKESAPDTSANAKPSAGAAATDNKETVPDVNAQALTNALANALANAHVNANANKESIPDVHTDKEPMPDSNMNKETIPEVSNKETLPETSNHKEAIPEESANKDATIDESANKEQPLPAENKEAIPDGNTNTLPYAKETIHNANADANPDTNAHVINPSD